MPDTTYYADGQWNVCCDLCGRKVKSGQVKKTWDGFYVCLRHKEERNPQDFLRGPRPTPPLPFTRPAPPDLFVLNGFRIMKEDLSGALLQEDTSQSLIVRT